MNRSLLKYVLIILVTTLAVSCRTTGKVKNGRIAYQVKQYAVAVDLLDEEYRKAKTDAEKAELAYMLAKSHDILQNFDKALEWFDATDQYQNSQKSKRDLAFALKKNERYGDAISVFSELYNNDRQNEYLIQINICRKAEEELNAIDDYFIEPFKANSRYSDYSPVYYEDDFIVFSSDRDESTGKEVYNWTGNAYSDLFIMNLQNKKVHNFDAVLNTANNEGTACFSKDFNEIFFTRCEALDKGKNFCRLYYSQRPNGFWMEPEPLMFFGTNTNFAHPTLIENDSVLIFSAAPTSSDKTYDLFYSVRVENGWSEAEIMPSPINTSGNEKFPTSYNDTLFFASDFHPGYGGYDLFKTYLRRDGSWAPVENLGIPINSGADDFGMVIKNDFKSNSDVLLQGYFTSSRNNGFSDDIFHFTKYRKEDPAEETEDISENKEEEDDYQVFLALKVVELIHEEGNPNKPVISRSAIEDANLKLTIGEQVDDFRTDQDGRYLTTVEEGSRISVLASKIDFLNAATEVTIPLKSQLSGDTTINVEIPLSKIIVDQEIVLNSIYYDFDKWFIRDDAKPALDSLTDILQLNPQINIELSSHTDCRGEEDFNEDLSQKRAQSAIEYMITNGIEPTRLIAKGYGESIPAADCLCNDCSEEQHQINRRTSFKILSRP